MTKPFSPLSPREKNTSKLPVLIYHHVSIVSMTKHVFVPTKISQLTFGSPQHGKFQWFYELWATTHQAEKKPFRRVFHLAQRKRFRKLNGSSRQG